MQGKNMGGIEPLPNTIMFSENAHKNDLKQRLMGRVRTVVMGGVWTQ